MDQQILALNKEEMEIKREMLKKMKLQDQLFSRSMEAFQQQLHEYPFRVNTNDDCII